MNLIKHIQQGESEMLEFKLLIDEEPIETVRAFATMKSPSLQLTWGSYTVLREKFEHENQDNSE